MTAYAQPRQIEEALAVLAQGPRTIVAGGTDFFPARVGKPLSEPVLDISRLEGLGGLTHEGAYTRIGALATWSDIIGADLPAGFDGLKLAAREIGGVQVQNAGTLCGNICNASPAADGVPNLLVLDAEVELVSQQGRRTQPVGEFITGNRLTGRRADELMTAVLVPKPDPAAHSTFVKLGARAYLVISIVMVAALLVPGADGRIAEARVAVGSCSPVACRLPALEVALAGQAFDPALVTADHLAPLTPIDDLRGPAAYRRDTALTLVRRALAELA
jgi:CO/xanthine dehydrogenase FAD-binding subunit